jgi:hypothetical protein
MPIMYILFGEICPLEMDATIFKLSWNNKTDEVQQGDSQETSLASSSRVLKKARVTFCGL